MKTVLIAAAVTLGVALAALSAQAEGPRASSGTAIVGAAEADPSAEPPAPPHYEWQYHYVGRHARYEGYWALVR